MAIDQTKVADLPKMVQGQRGGPRYVQMQGKAASCSECGGAIGLGELHVYDRVRGFGQPPRRYCGKCWQVNPRPQVNR